MRKIFGILATVMVMACSQGNECDCPEIVPEIERFTQEQLRGAWVKYEPGTYPRKQEVIVIEEKSIIINAKVYEAYSPTSDSVTYGNTTLHFRQDSWEYYTALENIVGTAYDIDGEVYFQGEYDFTDTAIRGDWYNKYVAIVGSYSGNYKVLVIDGEGMIYRKIKYFGVEELDTYTSFLVRMKDGDILLVSENAYHGRYELQEDGSLKITTDLFDGAEKEYVFYRQ